MIYQDKKKNEESSFRSDEQTDRIEVLDTNAESKINDEHVTKRTTGNSIAPITRLDKDKKEPIKKTNSNKDFYFKETDINLLKIIENMDKIVLKAQERQTISEDLDGFVECGIWDFAGQKEYYGTHQTFCTAQAVYILVADIKTALKDTGQSTDFDSIGSKFL